MTQLIKNDSQFAGLTVVGKLSTRHAGEREVYLVKFRHPADDSAEDASESQGILTVFNLSSKRYDVDGTTRKRVPDFIEEVKFLRSVQSDRCFPVVIDCGIENVGHHRLGWMLQPKINAESLTDRLRLASGLDISDIYQIMDTLFAAVDEITRYTQSGGHYNISTDNILLDFDDDNRLSGIYLIGLSDMGKAFHGITPFADESPDRRFRAPETSKRIFNHLTDIYALGIVMTMMITGDLGEDETDYLLLRDSSLSTIEFRKRIMKRNRDRMSTAQRLILEKATAATPSRRFQSVDRFRAFVAKLAKDFLSSTTPAESSSLPPMNPATAAECDDLEDKPTATLDVGATTGKLKMTEHTQNGSISAPYDIKRGATRHGLDEVAGMSDLKTLFRREFIRIIRNPKIAQAYGIKPSNCTLLYGPHGCGKTFIAEKAAQESGLKYKIVNPSGLGSIYIHGSQRKIAELFEEAEKKGPMILIFDEFDAIVPKRDSDLNNNQANEVNEMLAQLNNCASRGIYVLATTNRPGLIDPAIMRKGRVDRAVYVALPDKEARNELLRLEIEKRPHENIVYDVLASATENFTCSDITFIVEESARLCFEETLDRQLDKPLPLSMNRLMEVVKDTQPSVSDRQRKEYLELKNKMEKSQLADDRKKVGFAL